MTVYRPVEHPAPLGDCLQTSRPTMQRHFSNDRNPQLHRRENRVTLSTSQSLELLYLQPLQYSRSRHALIQPLFSPRQTMLSFILHSPLSPTHPPTHPPTHSLTHSLTHSPLVSPSLNTLSLPTRHSHQVEPNAVTNTLPSETLKFASPLCLPLRPVTICDHHCHQVAYHSLCHSATHHCYPSLTTMSFSHSLL